VAPIRNGSVPGKGRIPARSGGPGDSGRRDRSGGMASPTGEKSTPGHPPSLPGQPDRVATLTARHVEGGPWRQVGHHLDEEPVRPHPHRSSLPWQRSSQAALSIDGDAAGAADMPGLDVSRSRPRRRHAAAFGAELRSMLIFGGVM
jgi:hypothetical protein